MKIFIFFILLTTSLFASASSNQSEVMVHLFEWRWNDIARECETFLGPKGFKRIQVSPPQENAVYAGNPWFERYQPVSFDIISRSGNEAEFKSMIKRCDAVGVKIVVDAIINHMASTPGDAADQIGTTFTGKTYSRYNFPGLFDPADFNYCRGSAEAQNDIRDWNSRDEVLYCELVKLPDLNLEKSYVQDKLAEFLNRLLAFGVEGFRIDAAKHVPPQDMDRLFGRLKKTPYVYSEVIDGGDSPVRNFEYERFGLVSEFRFSHRLADVFFNGKLSWLQSFGEQWGFMSSSKALVFVDNHDTQRGGGLSFKVPEKYKLANVFMLAWPYGSPMIMSSFNFKHKDDSPPTSAVCGKDWVCEHRWPEMAQMVKFRKLAGTEWVTNWWSNGENQIAFGRGARGFVVINNENRELSQTLQTSLKPGTYCNILSEEKALSACLKGAGSSVTVDGNGKIQVRLQGMKALAIHADSLLKRK